MSVCSVNRFNIQSLVTNNRRRPHHREVVREKLGNIIQKYPSSPSSTCPLVLQSGHALASSSNPMAMTASSTTSGSKTISVKAEISELSSTSNVALKLISLDNGLNAVADLLGRSILIQLVSVEPDPKSGLEKKTEEKFAGRVGKSDGEVKYEAKFEVSPDFGEVGAVLLRNERHSEMYLRTITLTGFPHGPLLFTCNSWVQPKNISSEKRIFFTNKSYLPSMTPTGLRQLREKELENLRGNGEGERKSSERIYDYDTYNDLGNPDLSDELIRPVLGGKDHPYPRRCRTGRPHSKKDPSAETRGQSSYVPRDEEFSEVKRANFTTQAFTSVLQAAIPSVGTAVVDINLGFSSFPSIDSIYDSGFTMPMLAKGGLLSLPLRLVASIKQQAGDALTFDIPELMQRDRFAWLKDEEFAREALAGVNPMSIQLVTEFPLRSKLDPSLYGPAESLITKELIEQQIKGLLTFEEAMDRKRLFIIDYHDFLLPYVHKVRGLKGTTLYASRTLFFLKDDSTLTPIAIELTRPKSETQPQWRQVFSPSSEPTESHLWMLAKAHICAHESGYHELVIHWLRTHCCMEPYIIATHRQLSAMHPIHRLLLPHLRYTMKINSLARQILISGGGIIELSFSPQKYSMEMSSAAYDKLWRFDTQGLPADLISRGVAVEDSSAKHGLKLAIEDYPFANDGLLLWSAIRDWLQDYVLHYYPGPDVVQSDSELQAWWTEIRTKGHPDKEEGWPSLDTPSDLVEILNTIIWVASCHHAAVNFGQYAYGGYFPNRPTIARNNMPTEDGQLGREELFNFMQNPNLTLLKGFPTQIQATLVMAILAVLSNHSPDEEYLGEKLEDAWKEDPVIVAAFERYSENMKTIEGLIDERNSDMNLKNRSGAGIVPYQLLKPFSKSGVTGMGVPNSTSI